MPSQVKTTSDVRRIERFYQSYKLDYELVAMLLAFCIPKGKVKISMDRTEWQFGSNWYNILAVTVNYGVVGIPIWVEILKKRRGNSNAKERKKVMKKVFKMLGKDRIAGFFADREFVGDKWIRFLLKKQIPFYLRLKNNQYFKLNGQRHQIKKYFEGHQKLTLDNVYIYQTFLSLAITKTEDEDDIMAVLTNTQAKYAIKRYKKRWTIEVLFQSLKKRGFDMESTHLQHAKRVRKLFMLCSLAFALCFAVGFYRHLKISPIPVKNHGYKANSIFRSGLDFIREALKLNFDISNIFKELFKEAKIRLHYFYLYSSFVG